ncbi:MAG: dienelactone hydrolase family protein [Verrucomicrobia bacterium]|nr:dienelactone hydrolase family protein [Verrucomicrobiota bacterium]
MIKYSLVRFTLFAFLIGSTHLAFAQSKPALQQPPSTLPKDFPQLPPLLKTEGGTLITTKRQWENQREKIKADWLAFMGEFPRKRAPLKTEFLEKEDLGGFTRQYVRYQIEEGIFTDGYLFTPKDAKGKLPAVVVFHPTTPFQARGVAGLEPEYDEARRQGMQLVQRGYVVWCPRNFIFDEGTGEKSGARMWTRNAERIHKQHPTWTAMARMTFDAIRAADFVESLSTVDKKRIGCIGHSLGAKVALYAPAFDARYKASVSSEGGIGLKFSNWDAIWYLGKEIKDPGFELENHQVLSLVAPRAFLLLAGESADNDKSWAFIQSALPVYKLYGKRENLGWFNHREGHKYSDQARAVAEDFLDRHLK